MFIIDTAAVVALLVIVALAGLVGLLALGIGLGHTLVANRPVRLARREFVAHYYGHRATGHCPPASTTPRPAARVRRDFWQHRAVRHVYECPMRWADMDLLGHVNNVVYVDYLQEARVDMLRTHSRREVTGELAEGLVVVRHEVHYLAPLTFDFLPVSIECWVTDVRAASFTMAYEVFHVAPDEPDGRRVYLRATTVLTPFLFGAERPRRLSVDERSALEAYREPTPEWSQATGGLGRGDPGRRDKVGHYPVHVRFSDVDVYGHVNNVKYFEYFMEARILFSARLWRDLPEGADRPSMVVAHTDVDYRVPILFRPEPYDAWSWLTRVGDRSMTIESEICDGDTVLSRARVSMVFVDAETQRPAPPAPVIRERLLAAPGAS